MTASTRPQIRASLSPVTIDRPTIRASGASSSGPRRFRLTAYTGEPMLVSGFDRPLVLDLEGADLSTTVPALHDHVSSLWAIVGQVERLTVGPSSTPPLTAHGIFTPDPDDPEDIARRVLAKADAGFQWQASIGADAEIYERFPAGTSVIVNGREFVGPIIVARRLIPREISFVVLGADRRTAADVHAGRGASAARTPTVKAQVARPASPPPAPQGVAGDWVEGRILPTRGVKSMVARNGKDYDRLLPEEKRAAMREWLEVVNEFPKIVRRCLLSAGHVPANMTFAELKQAWANWNVGKLPEFRWRK